MTREKRIKMIYRFALFLREELEHRNEDADLDRVLVALLRLEGLLNGLYRYSVDVEVDDLPPDMRVDHVWDALQYIIRYGPHPIGSEGPGVWRDIHFELFDCIQRRRKNPDWSSKRWDDPSLLDGEPLRAAGEGCPRQNERLIERARAKFL